MTKEKSTKKVAKKRSFKKLQKLGYLTLAAGSVANAIFLAFMVSTPETGMYILAGFSTASAVYFVARVL